VSCAQGLVLTYSYGKPITMDDYEKEFLSEEEGANKLAVKRLTKKIGLEIRKMTVNSPNWCDAACTS
jgi:glycerol-3-phosphate O-acyltransferase/dihydroxyacetone phosphate acyltransferase